MRFSGLGVFSLLIIGAASTTIVRDEGTDYTVSVRTLTDEEITCYLETPLNDLIKFLPGDQNYTTEKFEILPGSSSMRCSVTIKNLDKDDDGDWVISFENDEGVGANQTFHITVNELTTTSVPVTENEYEENENEPTEREEEAEEEQEEEEKEDVEMLTLIEQIARLDSYIDISLNKESFEEACFIRPPNGDLVSTDEVIDNVLRRNPSKFVSCRVTIGPMTEELLGDWTLCGRSVVDEKMRCQPVNIAWNNNNPTANWNTRIEPTFFHPVNYGGRVNPGVMGSASVVSCHVITPADEDLILTDDVKYPHIERITNNPSVCSVAFSDIDSSMLGSWAIYGRFRSSFTALNEVRLPLNLYLYNSNDPYEQAYNITYIQKTIRVVNLGNTVTVQIPSSGQVDDCLLMTPTQEDFNLDNATKTMEGVTLQSLASPTACQLTISPVTEKVLGKYHMFGKFSNNNQFTEVRQKIYVLQEDPANPIIDEHRLIENLPAQRVDTEIGSSHSFTINRQTFINPESCHLRTPQGLQYTIMEGFNVPNVEVITDSRYECGVLINVLSETMLGEWTLIARATRTSDSIERRLTFTIRVEETFSLGRLINIKAGADLYVRLPKDTDEYETCRLYGPDTAQVAVAEMDTNHPQSCGFIVRKVNRSQNGTWSIVYGKGISYKGTVEVNVLDPSIPQYFDRPEEWFLGSAIDKIVGPKEAVYCRLQDFNGNTMFDGFGPCRVKLDAVTFEHHGAWTAVFGLAGAVLAQQHVFYVSVMEADPIPVVTNVTTNAPSVVLTCSIPVNYDVTGCKFRDPSGAVMIASHNVGEEGFVFEGAIVNYESDATSHDCSLRLTNPTEEHLGIWRCALDTTQGTYYGFLDVHCPWIDPYDDHSLSRPSLRAPYRFVSGLVGEAVYMSCSIPASIRYCYFKSENGTVYSVGPAIKNENYEYIGNGLDAGECGMKIRGLRSSDSGRWTCSAGLVGSEHTQEEADGFIVEIEDKLQVAHYWKEGTVVVQSRTYREKPLDYCRFVRRDGLGFTSENPPRGYKVNQWLSGHCELIIEKPQVIDRHPWTVAVKLMGKNGEVQARTPVAFLMIPGSMPFSFAFFLWMMVTMLCLIMMALGVALVPKKNRDWTYDRAGRIRNSFRRPARTPPPAYTEEPVKRPEDNPTAV